MIPSIRKTALETYDNTALFSNGPAKPVTIAVPSGSQWEGLSVDRANLAQPGLIIMDKGKVYGDGEGYTIDPGSVKRAFDEWRQMCEQSYAVIPAYPSPARSEAETKGSPSG